MNRTKEAETLAEAVIVALLVHGFENDAAAESCLRVQKHSLTEMLERALNRKDVELLKVIRRIMNTTTEFSPAGDRIRSIYLRCEETLEDYL